MDSKGTPLKSDEDQKTISESNYSWQEIQRSTFTNWCNTVLKDSNIKINNIYDDLTDGTVLIQMYQVLSGKKVRRYNKNPKILQHVMENLDIVMKCFKEDGLSLVNIGICLFNDLLLFFYLLFFECFIKITFFDYFIKY